MLITPISKCFGKNCQFIRGSFIGISKANSKVVRIKLYDDMDTQRNEVIDIDYDALVLCHGRPYSPPIRPSSIHNSLSLRNRINEIEDFYKNIRNVLNKDSDSKVIVTGGGLVGVELIADIAHRLLPKNNRNRLILISRSKLLNTLPSAARNYAVNWLVKNSVSVCEDDEIISTTEMTDESKYIVQTKSGQRMEVNIIIDCTGVLPKLASKYNYDSQENNVDTLETTVDLPYNQLDLVTVDKHLSCISVDYGISNGIFAAGDIVQHGLKTSPSSHIDDNGVSFAFNSLSGYAFGQKQALPIVRNAHLAESQAELVAENVRIYLSNRDNLTVANLSHGLDDSEKVYNHGNTVNTSVSLMYHSYPKDVFGNNFNPLLACVSLGPRDGIVVFNNVVVCGTFVALLAGFIKFVIERSKISEIRQEWFGRLFWSFGHVVTNFIHRWMVRLVFIRMSIYKFVSNLFSRETQVSKLSTQF